MIAIALAERRLVPGPVVRAGIRRLLRDRLAQEARRFTDRDAGLRRFIEGMAAEALAPSPQAANRQHYEVPTEFFQLVLGRHLKYSAGLWEPGTADLDAAEEAMLALTCDRAELHDGQTVLELGCGWGSLSLWMAERYPRSRILAVSNSRTQGEFIRAQAVARGLRNLEVRTADMNAFTPGEGAAFDRIVSVEMFEHLRNWPELFRRLAGWLAPGGRVFVHVFAHRRFAYPFEVDGEGDWMARHFFTGGIMPAHDLAGRIPGPLEEEERWLVPGTHYARTAEAWVGRLGARRAEALAVLRRGLPAREARLQLERWRLFFLACAELFGFRGGTEWVVSHHRLRARGEEERRPLPPLAAGPSQGERRRP
jgi:cyclopropane-fatty-acyl-phospholipid synthase